MKSREVLTIQKGQAAGVSRAGGILHVFSEDPESKPIASFPIDQVIGWGTELPDELIKKPEGEQGGASVKESS